MMDVLSTKIIKHATLEISKGMKKRSFFSFAFTIVILIRNENIKYCVKYFCM